MKPPPPNYGSFSSEKTALQAVLDRLISALQPFRIYLFGSRAEGRARPDSDFDLVVVFDDQAANADADYDEVYAPLLGLGVGCDVIPCRWSDFQEVLVDTSNPWARTLALARRVYERPEQAGRELMMENVGRFEEALETAWDKQVFDASAVEAMESAKVQSLLKKVAEKSRDSADILSNKGRQEPSMVS